MGTAFSSSLFGLGGSLVLGFIDLQAGHAQNRFFNELEEWLSGVTQLIDKPEGRSPILAASPSAEPSGQIENQLALMNRELRENNRLVTRLLVDQSPAESTASERPATAVGA